MLDQMWLDLHLFVARGHVQSGTKYLLRSMEWVGQRLCSGSTKTVRTADVRLRGLISPQDFVGISVVVYKLCLDGNRSRWPFQSWVAFA